MARHGRHRPSPEGDRAVPGHMPPRAGSEPEALLLSTLPELSASQRSDHNLHAAVLGPALLGAVRGIWVGLSGPNGTYASGIQFEVLLG